MSGNKNIPTKTTTKNKPTKKTKKNMYSSVLLEKWKMFLITLISSFIQPFNSFILNFQSLQIDSRIINLWNLFWQSFWCKRVTSVVFHGEFFFVSNKGLYNILINLFRVEFVDECVSCAIEDFGVFFHTPTAGRNRYSEKLHF